MKVIDYEMEHLTLTTKAKETCRENTDNNMSVACSSVPSLDKCFKISQNTINCDNGPSFSTRATDSYMFVRHSINLFLSSNSAERAGSEWIQTHQQQSRCL